MDAYISIHIYTWASNRHLWEYAYYRLAFQRLIAVSAKYIAFEGCDGAGKSTQVRLLSEFLEREGFKVLRLKEPSDTNPVGKYIRKIMVEEGHNAETMALLFAADRKVHIEGEIRPNLNKYDFIISDRCYLSSFVYQSIQGADLDWLYELNKFIIKPDMIVLLKVGFTEFMHRRGESPVIFEKEVIQKEVPDRFLEIAKKLELNGENILIVNGLKTEVDVHKEIKENMMNLCCSSL